MDPESLEQLVYFALEARPDDQDEKSKNAFSLLKTFIARGFYNMMQILKSEYVDFLKTYDLLHGLFKFLLEDAQTLSACPEDPLVSSLLLELRADYVREKASTSNILCLGKGEEKKASGAQIFSSGDGNQFYVLRGESASDVFHFTVALQFGQNKGQYFDGILQCDAKPEENKDGLFLVPSKELCKLGK